MDCFKSSHQSLADPCNCHFNWDDGEAYVDNGWQWLTMVDNGRQWSEGELPWRSLCWQWLTTVRWWITIVNDNDNYQGWWHLRLKGSRDCEILCQVPTRLLLVTFFRFNTNKPSAGNNMLFKRLHKYEKGATKVKS